MWLWVRKRGTLKGGNYSVFEAPDYSPCPDHSRVDHVDSGGHMLCGREREHDTVGLGGLGFPQLGPLGVLKRRSHFLSNIFCVPLVGRKGCHFKTHFGKAEREVPQLAGRRCAMALLWVSMLESPASWDPLSRMHVASLSKAQRLFRSTFGVSPKESIEGGYDCPAFSRWKKESTFQKVFEGVQRFNLKAKIPIPQSLNPKTLIYPQLVQEKPIKNTIERTGTTPTNMFLYVFLSFQSF